MRVGLITDLGQLDDNGFNELAFRGVKRAEKELGSRAACRVRDRRRLRPEHDRRARDGYDLVIGVGFAQGDAIGKVAQNSPRHSRSSTSTRRSCRARRPTQGCSSARRRSATSSATWRASRRRAGKDVISAVGGMKEPPVDRFIAGYFAGARRPRRDRLIHDYSQDWDDQAKCKELALNQIARGSNVIFQVAGGCGLGALNAAGERERWGSASTPTSPRPAHPHERAEGVDAAVFLTIEAIQDGSWKGGGNATFGLEGGRRRPREGQRRRAAGGRRQGRRDQAQIADGEISGIPTEVGEEPASGDRGDDPDPRRRGHRGRGGRGRARRRRRR